MSHNESVSSPSSVYGGLEAQTWCRISLQWKKKVQVKMCPRKPSWYNRDLQLYQYLYFLCVWICLDSCGMYSQIMNEREMRWVKHAKKTGESITQSCPTLCDPVDCSPPGSSVHGDSPGKNTGVGCHFLLQGIFPTQGSNLGGFFTILATRESPLKS